MDKIKVIVLNGPPSCGKDSIGKKLLEELKDEGRTAFKGEFKGLLLDILRNTLGLSQEAFDFLYADRDFKEGNQPLLNGHTLRELMICISEEYIKPMLGRDYIGKVELSKIKRGKPSVLVYTDGGFYDEIKPLLMDDQIELHIFHVYRAGCSFSGDSRGYVTGVGVGWTVLKNNGTIGEAVDTIRHSVKL